jgi:hypothetical protein
VPFGTERSWSADDIWLRPSFDLDEMPTGRLVRNVWNDSLDEVYLWRAVDLPGTEPPFCASGMWCYTTEAFGSGAEHVVAALPQ